mmetsp:Transcript_121454/g.388462  ORF Transcript_121454/g.388462 Transcript_121454/m.388462 type:complete len:335 (-) Transcript_121454:1026-2030(-)
MVARQDIDHEIAQDLDDLAGTRDDDIHGLVEAAALPCEEGHAIAQQRRRNLVGGMCIEAQVVVEELVPMVARVVGEVAIQPRHRVHMRSDVIGAARFPWVGDEAQLEAAAPKVGMQGQPDHHLAGRNAALATQSAHNAGHTHRLLVLDQGGPKVLHCEVGRGLRVDARVRVPMDSRPPRRARGGRRVPRGQPAHEWQLRLRVALGLGRSADGGRPGRRIALVDGGAVVDGGVVDDTHGLAVEVHGARLAPDVRQVGVRAAHGVRASGALREQRLALVACDARFDSICSGRGHSVALQARVRVAGDKRAGGRIEGAAVGALAYARQEEHPVEVRG